MEILVGTIFLAILGLFVGSFLHVVADRIISGESIFFGRSRCDTCKKPLTWLELLPVVSFLLQKGRCRNCKTKLSSWYPLSELGTGVVYALTFLTVYAYPLEVKLLLFLLLSVLLIIFLVDAKYGLIPFPLVVLAVFLTLPLLLLQPSFNLVESLIAGLVIGGFFLMIFALTRGKGMGFGDVIFAFFMGLLLSLPKAVLALYIAFLTGAAVALILVLTGRKKLKGGTIAFGPFLVLGTIVALLWGDYLVSYVLHNVL